MTEKDFKPLIEPIEIPETAYRLQLGYIDNRIALRVLEGEAVMKEHLFKDDELGEKGLPHTLLMFSLIIDDFPVNAEKLRKVVKKVFLSALDKIEPKVYLPSEEFLKGIGEETTEFVSYEKGESFRWDMEEENEEGKKKRSFWRHGVWVCTIWFLFLTILTIIAIIRAFL
ncbi:MAG: hypothetical protein ACFFBT_12040 [Promethearchaeota archaeon]